MLLKMWRTSPNGSLLLLLWCCLPSAGPVKTLHQNFLLIKPGVLRRPKSVSWEQEFSLLLSPLPNAIYYDL